MSCGYLSLKDGYDMAHCPTTPLPPAHSQAPACSLLLPPRSLRWAPGLQACLLESSPPRTHTHSSPTVLTCHTLPRPPLLTTACMGAALLTARVMFPTESRGPHGQGRFSFIVPVSLGLSMGPGQKRHQELTAKLKGTLSLIQLRAL